MTENKIFKWTAKPKKIRKRISFVARKKDMPKKRILESEKDDSLERELNPIRLAKCKSSTQKLSRPSENSKVKKVNER